MQIGVTFDEFFCAVVLEADGQLAILTFAFDFDDRPDAVFGMAHARADQRIFRRRCERRARFAPYGVRVFLPVGIIIFREVPDRARSGAFRPVRIASRSLLRSDRPGISARKREGSAARRRSSP